MVLDLTLIVKQKAANEHVARMRKTATKHAETTHEETIWSKLARPAKTIQVTVLGIKLQRGIGVHAAHAAGTAAPPGRIPSVAFCLLGKCLEQVSLILEPSTITETWKPREFQLVIFHQFIQRIFEKPLGPNSSCPAIIK